MAKLTESYLKKMIKQVLKENEEGRYPPPYEKMTPQDEIIASLNNAETDLEEALQDPSKTNKYINFALEEIRKIRDIIEGM